MTPRNYVERDPTFTKHYTERISPNPKLVKQFHHRLAFLLSGRGDLVNDHELGEQLAGRRAFSITDDIRVVYRHIDATIILYDIGSHDEVYR